MESKRLAWGFFAATVFAVAALVGDAKNLLLVSLLLLAAGVGVFGCYQGGRQGSTDAGDTGTESATGDDSLWECFDGPLDDTPALEEELDESWEPCGPHWTFNYLPIDSWELIDGPPLHDAATVRLALTTTLPDPCWQLTSVTMWGTATHPRVRLLGVRAFHHELTECDATTRTERRVVSLSLDAGCWVLIDLISGERLSFDIFNCDAVADDCECSENWPDGLPVGAECAADCQCASFSSVCLPVSTAQRECGVPCTIDEDCPAGTCPVAADAGPAICEDLVQDECQTDEDCPATHICYEGEDHRFCLPNHELNQLTRHGCGCDAECETPGLVCTLETWPGGRGAGYCNLPCRSLGDICPGMHDCGYSLAFASPVCEWVGE